LDKQVAALLAERFAAALPALAAPGECRVTAAELKHLRERWGDLTPVTALAAAFASDNAKLAFKGTLAQLIRLVEAAVDDRFEAFKFDQNIDQQLYFMDREQIEQWKRPRVRAEVTDRVPGADAASHAAALDDVRGSMRIALDTCIRRQTGGPGAQPTAPALDLVHLQRLLGETLHNGNPKTAVEQFIAEQKTTLAQLQADLLTVDLRLLDAKGLLGLASFFWSQMKQKALDLTDQKQLEATLGVLKTRLRGLSSADQPVAGGIVATVNTWSPRFTLAVGDCVQSISCMHYAFGPNRHWLLGYASDAHTQSVASFFLEPSDFASVAEFNRVADSLGAAAGGVGIMFDGDQQRFVFTCGQDHIVSRPIAHGFLRRMLKLGVDRDGNAGIRLDLLHRQPHRHYALMEAQAKALIADIRAEALADSREPITVKASANPSGTNSETGQFWLASQVTPFLMADAVDHW
jgi:hypothetical protein